MPTKSGATNQVLMMPCSSAFSTNCWNACTQTAGMPAHKGATGIWGLVRDQYAGIGPIVSSSQIVRNVLSFTSTPYPPKITIPIVAKYVPRGCLQPSKLFTACFPAWLYFCQTNVGAKTIVNCTRDVSVFARCKSRPGGPTTSAR